VWRAVPGDPSLARIAAAMQRLGRRANLPRLHEHFAARAGVAIDRGAYGVLLRVADEGPHRVTALARALGVEPSTVTRQVQVLEAAGCVSRSPDPDDRRAHRVAVTDQGLDALARLGEARCEVLAEVLAGWGEADRLVLAASLERFADDLVDYAGRL